MNEYIDKLLRILISFLGEPKGDMSDNYQLQFSCPRCIEHKGDGEKSKYNLEVNLQRSVFNCWSCSSMDDDMHGSIFKLIRMYGNAKLLEEYRNTLMEMKSSELYKIKFNENDFALEKEQAIAEGLYLPDNYHKIQENKAIPNKVIEYLKKRNIGFDIINKFDIGFTTYDENNKQLSSRIIIPSYNEYNELNYWTGRDFTNLSYRQKYFNPKVERKDIIFNENKVCWDADITLVEGPFDHIVVPNSIPLLGKKITPKFKIYESLMTRCNANVNIFLDGDAFEAVKEIYSLLNHGKLYNRIRFIPVSVELDPSEIYQNWGKKGIIDHLKTAAQIKDVYLT